MKRGDLQHMQQIERASRVLDRHGAGSDRNAAIILQAAAWSIYRRHGALATAEILFNLGEVFADEVPAQPHPPTRGDSKA